MATRMNRPMPNPVLRVFYRDYGNGAAIPSSRPEALLASRIAPLAERLLDREENFLGVVDRNDVILQCFIADDPAAVTLELLFPEAPGCLRLTLPREEALQRLAQLPEVFDQALLQGARYIG